MWKVMNATGSSERMEKAHEHRKMGRRDFLRSLVPGTLAAGAALSSCGPSSSGEPSGEMTCRLNPKNGDRVSVLGYGMMRLPTIDGGNARDTQGDIDQEMVNHQVDYALEHGVNYFDTAPRYCRALSEKALGKALSRHSRDTFFVATKMSNQERERWDYQFGVDMFENSLKDLQVDYIDYYLLHGIGSGWDQESGMENFQGRFIENGLLDYLMEQRRLGRIRNLGFSFHGTHETFEYLLSLDEEVHWDFVQIQLNYVDWLHAEEQDTRFPNVNAQYAYSLLERMGIPTVIMEPLLGGRLSSLPDRVVARLKSMRPSDSAASWALRFAADHENVLTVLSGMTYTEHLMDNVRTCSPLEPLSTEELDWLEETAKLILTYPTIPCNECQYCMPCPYGVDIPGVLTHYNKCVNEGNLITSTQSSLYRQARRAFLVGYDRSVPRLRQAEHCIGCGQCLAKCPQSIDIPAQMERLASFAEDLRRQG